MRVRTIKILATTALAAGFSLSLSGCMQDGAQRAAAPTPASTVPGFGLYYMDEGASAKLAYGAPNSDDVDLMLECAKGSRQVQVTEAAGAAHAPVLTLVSAGRRADFKAEAQTGDGSTILVANATTDAAPLQAFRRSGKLEVAYAGARVGVNASADERPGVERFFAACERRSG
jgi:hypothetical protein